MKIFNSIRLSNNKEEENLVLLYEQKLEERKSELLKLDNLLKSKRKEVAEVLEGKKQLNKELENLETAKNIMERELEKINERLQLLIKFEIEEKETTLSIKTDYSLFNNKTNDKYSRHNGIEAMKEETEDLIYHTKEIQNKLKSLREEEAYLVQIKEEISLSIEKYNHLVDEISSAEERLKVLLDKEKKMGSKSFKQFYTDLGLNKFNNSFKISLNKKTKEYQRCAAITKKGERCCKRSLPKRKYCTIHSNLLR